MTMTVAGESQETPRKIAPRGAGTIEWVAPKPGEERGHYVGRISLADGTRPWVRCPPSAHSPQAEFKAREYVGHEAEKARAHGLTGVDFGIKPRGKAAPVAVARGTGETVADYADRWLKSRKGKIATVGSNGGHLAHHILPVLGSYAMTAVTSKEIEDVVAALDAKVEASELSSKTAKNVWGTCSKMFDDATHSKPATGLRCLTADPSEGVRGPDDDDPDKILQFLYPSDFATFMACEAVSPWWRRNVAIAVYLCLRHGEQRALAWPSIDLEHGVATVCETFDRSTHAVREGTKSGAARVVPIRPELLPLLKAMHRESGGVGLVCRLQFHNDMAHRLREQLLRAGVDRLQLHKGTSVSKVLRWHDLRATGLTWLAVEGASPTEIRDIAGHTQTSMTDRYMRAAGILRSGRFGQPFPPIPESLWTAPPVCLRGRKPRQAIDITVRRRGLEPLCQLRR